MDKIIFGMLAVPLIFVLWHWMKINGNRPDAYRKIDERPVIPAVIIDVDMPFPSMVSLLFKLAVAALPAIVLVAVVLGFLFGGMFLALTGGRY